MSTATKVQVGVKGQIKKAYYTNRRGRPRRPPRRRRHPTAFYFGYSTW